MADYEIVPMQEPTVSRLISLLDRINISPSYQRDGNVWNSEFKENFIDTIVNELDVPKIYFAFSKDLDDDNDQSNSYIYDILDGKQRIEAIAEFYKGELSLPEEFVYFKDEVLNNSLEEFRESKDAEGGRIDIHDLKQSHKRLYINFMSYKLPIYIVKTDNYDIIEEMFVRLNAGVALNAAEKRNAISGLTRDLSNDIADKHDFFEVYCKIKNRRFKYRELASKFLLIEWQYARNGKISSLKAKDLKNFYEYYSRKNLDSIESHEQDQLRGHYDAVKNTLDNMSKVFEESDNLLKSIGSLVVFYISFRDESFRQSVNRSKLQSFEDIRSHVWAMNVADTNYDRNAFRRLREYNVLVQSSNDGSALTRRAEILKKYISGDSNDVALEYLDDLSDSVFDEEEEA